MNIQKALILYKTSTYQHRLLTPPGDQTFKKMQEKYLRKFERTHRNHYATLIAVEQELHRHGICYKKVARGKKFNPKSFDLVISVGGDGTFLEAARKVTTQPTLGVNSDPTWSVGRFCVATAETFPLSIESIEKNRFQIISLNRLALSISGDAPRIPVLNDVLVCHKNPAAMSRYIIKIGSQTEEHRSSGIWVSTPAGSTGAILSAGGVKMELASKGFQYKSRELYEIRGKKSKLQGGIITSRQKVSITSLMKEGMVYVDGSHLQIPFTFGEKLVLSRSNIGLPFVSFTAHHSFKETP